VIGDWLLSFHRSSQSEGDRKSHAKTPNKEEERWCFEQKEAKVAKGQSSEKYWFGQKMHLRKVEGIRFCEPYQEILNFASFATVRLSSGRSLLFKVCLCGSSVQFCSLCAAPATLRVAMRAGLGVRFLSVCTQQKTG
jgi:hypothetical protein